MALWLFSVQMAAVVDDTNASDPTNVRLSIRIEGESHNRRISIAANSSIRELLLELMVDLDRNDINVVRDIEGEILGSDMKIGDLCDNECEYEVAHDAGYPVLEGVDEVRRRERRVALVRRGNVSAEGLVEGLLSEVALGLARPSSFRARILMTQWVDGEWFFGMGDGASVIWGQAGAEVGLMFENEDVSSWALVEVWSWKLTSLGRGLSLIRVDALTVVGNGTSSTVASPRGSMGGMFRQMVEGGDAPRTFQARIVSLWGERPMCLCDGEQVMPCVGGPAVEKAVRDGRLKCWDLVEIEGWRLVEMHSTVGIAFDGCRVVESLSTEMGSEN